MAKKDENQSMYVNAAEARRKAIGNPNKNVHAKRNGSNYKGSASAQAAADKLAQANKPKERQKLAPQVKLTMWIMVIVAVASIILENSVFKGNDRANAVMMLALGLACGGVYYARRTTNGDREMSSFEKALDVILLVVCILYAFLGMMGLRA